MITMTLSELGQCVNGEGVFGNAFFRGVAIDSRRVRKGNLFAALAGTRSDGHDFIHSAMDEGAVVALVNRRVNLDIDQVVVADVQAALGSMARYWRAKVDPRVIGITGSNGKTTTKEMVSSILSIHHATHATQGNYNNELGVPLTVFELDEAHEFAVIEMGANKSGDIAYLAEIAAPGIGLVTNIGPAHLEGFGDELGVARAKGELYAALPQDGWAVINAEEPYQSLWQDMCTADQHLTFGRCADSDIRAERQGSEWAIHAPSGSFQLKLDMPGEHNVMNAVAATAVAVAAGVPLDQIQAGLDRVRSVPGRLNRRVAPEGWTVIDDTYNANPASLYAAMQVLVDTAGVTWLVLGDMAELGAQSRKLHAEMGEAARTLGIDRLFSVGEFSEASADAFGTGASHFADINALMAALLADLEPSVHCLVKGSRSMGMERVVEALTHASGVRGAV